MPADGERERYVDAKVLAEIMGVSVPTIKRWTRDGMPSEKRGLKARRFLPSECIEWARSRNRSKAKRDDSGEGPACGSAPVH